MRILIAEDSIVSREQIHDALTEWGYDVEAVADGTAAWQVLQGPAPPPLAVLDWHMPGIEGVDLCRLIRATPQLRMTYVILLTARSGTADLVEGLGSGADDYVSKAADPLELRARLSVAERVLALQQGLADRVRELEDAISRVRELQALLPMCAWCKRVRADANYWQHVEDYIAGHLDIHVSHGMCPECLQEQQDAFARSQGQQPGAMLDKGKPPGEK